MKRAIALSLIVAAAGCGNDGTSSMVDMPPTGGGTDMTVQKPDMATPAPTGSKMLAGSYFIYGITDDDQVVVDDLNANKFFAIAAGSTKASTISSMGGRFTIRGKAVFHWEAADQTTGVGIGNIWTAAGGLRPLTMGESSLAGRADISADANWIFYSGTAEVDGSLSDFYVAKSDTTGPIKFASAAKNDTSNDLTQCSSSGDFSKSGKLIFLACGLGKNGGNSLWLVDPANGMKTVLNDDVGVFFVNDPQGKFVAAPDPKDPTTLTIYSTSGGMPIPAGTGVSGREVHFTPDGSALIYITTDGNLMRVPTSGNTAVVKLAGPNITHMRLFRISQNVYASFSADSKWVILSNVFDPMSGYGDIFMASTETPGMPTTLVGTATGEIFGDAFTQDSQYVLYYTEISTVQISNGNGLIGTFNAKPVAGGNPVPIAKRVWVSYDGVGSISAYNDNYKSGKNYGRGDLRIVDIKNPMVNKLVAVQAEGEFFPTYDKKTFVYSTTASPMTSGMYTIPGTVQ